MDKQLRKHFHSIEISSSSRQAQNTHNRSLGGLKYFLEKQVRDNQMDKLRKTAEGDIKFRV